MFAAGLVLVPGMVLAALAVRSGSESLQRVIGRQLAREAGHTADRLASALRAERETLRSLARQDLMREVRVADIDKRVALSLATLRHGHPMRLGYVVLDGEARVVTASDPRWMEALPPWLATAHDAAQGERVLGPLRPGPEQEPVLALTTPIPDPDEPRRRLGTLVGILDWGAASAVTATVRQELVAQGVEADVLVCHRAGARRVAGPAADEGPEGVCAVAADAGETPDHTLYGEVAIVGRAALPPDLPAWTLLVVEPVRHALAPAARLRRQLWLATGIALAAGLLLAALFAERVVRPLSELTGAIRGLARGDAEDRQVPVRSDDEVGTLARAFNDMAADLDRVQRDLVEAEKFAFVGELAAGVAHEIRTSLGVLGSSTQILERSLPQGVDGDLGELAQMIRAEVARLGSVVDDLLTLERARPLRLEAVPLSAPVRRAVEFVRPRAQERGVRIACRVPEEEPLVSCDPELIGQVAVNLLVNALQAVDEGGCVQVDVLEAADGRGGFEVRDDGPGIPEEMRERLFQPFVTGREGGVGLGMTFVKRVVHDHRGRVSVESAPGAGATVRVQVPLAGGAG